MKYVVIVIISLLTALFESTLGGFRPFVFLSYLIPVSIFLYWLLDSYESFFFLGVGGLFLDLFKNNWIGTTYLSFFIGLLILTVINSFIDVFNDRRKLLASILHLVLSLSFNYFFILLQNGNLSIFSYEFLVISLSVTLFTYLIFWVLLEGRVVKRKSLYV